MAEPEINENDIWNATFSIWFIREIEKLRERDGRWPSDEEKADFADSAAAMADWAIEALRMSGIEPSVPRMLR